MSAVDPLAVPGSLLGWKMSGDPVGRRAIYLIIVLDAVAGEDVEPGRTQRSPVRL